MPFLFSCSTVEQMFGIAEDPEIVALGAELLTLEDDYADIKSAYDAQYDDYLTLQAQLAVEGLNLDTANDVMAALVSASGRITALGMNLDSVGSKISLVKDKIEEKQTEEGVPWYVTLGGILLAAAAPTMNGIPIIGPLMARFARPLEAAGLRNAAGRVAEHQADKVAGVSGYAGPGDTVPARPT